MPDSRFTEKATLHGKAEKKNEEQPSEQKEEGNRYDKIIKENLKELAPSVIGKIFGLKNFRLEALPQVKLQTTVEKEPDFLLIIYDKRSPKGRILQIEFEGQDEEITDWRIHEYSGMEGKIYRMELDQRLIYYGEGTPKNIKGKLKHTHYRYKYPFYNLSSIGFRKILDGDTPQEVVFANLANPEGVSAAVIVE